jgi:hypothetical protein
MSSSRRPSKDESSKEGGGKLSILQQSLEPKPIEPETDFDKSPPSPPSTVSGENNLPPVLISDIDHTIAWPNRDEFMDFSKSENDIPNEEVIAKIKEWYSSTEKPTIYFVTNRAVGWRDVTVRWLIKYFPPSQYRWTLRMRPANDFYSSPASIKEDFLLDEISKKYSVHQVWEDDDECILMYQTYSLTVFDAKGTWPK